MSKIGIKVGILLVSLAVSILLFEGLVRVYNSSGRNYDIEMWKYGTRLKRPAPEPELGIEHIPGASGTFQNTEIKINSLGFRDREYPLEKPAGVYRILVLGSSITFGWGVDQTKVFTELIENRLNSGPEKRRVEVINAGVGNYNTARQIAQFKKIGLKLQPDMVILSYFVNDLEELDPPKANFFVKNFQLAVMIWSKWNYFATKYGLRPNFEELYGALYKPDSAAWQAMEKRIGALAETCRREGIRLVLAMTPDIHDFSHYQFGYVHELVADLARKQGLDYLDFLEPLKDHPASELWNIPGDPHPNAKGHRLMADLLHEFLTGPDGLAKAADRE